MDERMYTLRVLLSAVCLVFIFLSPEEPLNKPFMLTQNVWCIFSKHLQPFTRVSPAVTFIKVEQNKSSHKDSAVESIMS